MGKKKIIFLYFYDPLKLNGNYSLRNMIKISLKERKNHGKNPMSAASMSR